MTINRFAILLNHFSSVTSFFLMINSSVVILFLIILFFYYTNKCTKKTDSLYFTRLLSLSFSRSLALSIWYIDQGECARGGPKVCPLLRKSMPVESITSLAELEKLIRQGEPIAVDFYANWCGPCRMISPKFETFSTTYSKVKFIKVDVDQAPEIAKELAVTALPTFVFFRKGEKVETIVGADPARLEAIIKEIAQ